MQRVRSRGFCHFQTMRIRFFRRHNQMHGVCRCDRHTAPAYGKNHKHHQPDLFDEPYEQKYTLKKCAACLSNKSINAVTQISKFWTRLFFRSPTYYFFHRFRLQFRTFRIFYSLAASRVFLYVLARSSPMGDFARAGYAAHAGHVRRPVLQPNAVPHPGENR